MKKIIEIASYPKCGNTWLRYIFAKVFNIDANKDIPDIHQHNDKTSVMMKQVDLSTGSCAFYKSHMLDFPKMQPDSIVLIYRHPLDVFFSSLNYFKLHNDVEKFHDGLVKSVDEIIQDGELSFYFEKFCTKLGGTFYEGMLGELSNYESYMRHALTHPKVIPVKYEDIIDDPVAAISSLLSKLMPDERFTLHKEMFAEVDAQTKYSNNAFFWKAIKNNYINYLNQQDVDLFFKKNQYFRDIGY